ncbi:MAG: hypothetical protein GY842_22975 [bacterium]|nr:hypothetical protein [bacterium]
MAARSSTGRRGVALVLALIAVVIGVTLATSFLAAQSTTIGIARNVENHSKAVRVAESGLEVALAYVRANSDWRTEQPHGTWVTDESFGEGTFTIVGEDGWDTDGDGAVNGDGDLTDDTDDLLTLTVTGRVSGASHVAQAVVTPVLSTSMVGHWKLDEASGTTALDVSGHDNHATLHDMDPASDWVTGVIGGALDFDGSNDYVQVPHSEELNGSIELTYATWLYPRSWSGMCQVLAKSVHGGGSGRAQMGIFSDGGRLAGRAETSGGRMNAYATLPTLNTWSHVAVVFDGVSLRVYVDGVEGGAITFSNRTLVQTTDVLNFSKRVGTPQYYFDGKIDDIRVYGRALSADDVAALAAGGQLNLFPSGVGSSTVLVGTGSGSGNWDLVNEETADDDSTYVASSGGPSFEMDTYTTGDSGISSGSISSVTIHIRVCKGSGGSKVQTVLHTVGTDYLGAQINLNSTTYSNHSTTYSANPATSAAWTWAEIDAMEIGVASRKGARCTQIYAEVQYDGASSANADSTYTVRWQEAP